MLVIRKEQMELIQKEAELNFARGILSFIRRERPYSVPDLSEDVLQQRVLWGIKKARDFGIDDYYAKAIVLYVLLMFVVGPDFDCHPACQSVMQDPYTPPEARVFALVEKERAIPWEEIAKTCDTTNWGG